MDILLAMHSVFLSIHEIYRVPLFTFVGGLAVAFFVYRLTLRKEEAERRRHAKYLAVRVRLLLEAFVTDCALAAADIGDDDDTGGTSATVPSPVLAYPDVRWDSIDPDLMRQALELANDLAAAERTVDEVFAVVDSDAAHQTRQALLTPIGIRAVELTKAFGRLSGIPYEPEELTLSKFATAQLAVEESKKRQAELNARFAALTVDATQIDPSAAKLRRG